MILPTPIRFDAIPLGGVFTSDNLDFGIECDATTYAHLGTGVIVTGQDPAKTFTYFPAAKLVLG